MGQLFQINSADICLNSKPKQIWVSDHEAGLTDDTNNKI